MKRWFSKIKAFSQKRKKLTVCICAFLALYLFVSVFISVKTGIILRTSNRNFGENNPYSEIISEQNFERLCYRRFAHGRIKPDSAVREAIIQTPIITLHWFIGAKTYYLYSYKIYIDGEKYNPGWAIPMTVTSGFSGGKWRITDVYEPE